MNRIQLTNWTVTGFWPWTPLLGRSMETGFALGGVTPTISAKVPGSVYDDLIRADLIKDPEIGLNSLECEWVANRWWVYECKFPTPTANENKRSILVFEGIDYEAIIFLNGKQVAEHKGMYTSCRIDLTDLCCVDGENVLRVVIKSAPDEMSQVGKTSQTYTQKARFNYKWDFCTRIVNLGLYAPVYIEQKGSAELAHTVLRVRDLEGNVHFDTDITAIEDTAANLRVTITDPDGNIAVSLEKSISLIKGENDFSADFKIEKPMLWWPNGYGEQPLYRVNVTVLDANGSDEYTCNLGIRTITYEQCDNAREDSLPYLLRVNGKRIYIKGANMTPLEMLYGCVTKNDYETMVGLAKKGNFNLLRIWGGGLIETEEFYNICDREGILLWQEFIQSSSGIDNIPSKIPEFLELLKRTVYAAVYSRRNHPSLALWGGGNELMSESNIPSTYEDENLAMIKKITDSIDPDRLFLPTSASGPIEYMDVNRPGENHDVHGPWEYAGVVNHYDIYNRSDSQLHSEFGCNGMSSEKTIYHICPPDHIGVLDNSDLVWRHHGEWWNALPRDVEVVGKPKDIMEMIKIDQFIQGESIRYSVEANNRRAFKNCGSIIWAINEPWPNVANCSLIDHYFNPKLAYKMVGEAFSPLHASLKYESLYIAKDKDFKGEIFLHSDVFEDKEVTLEWTVGEVNGGILAKGKEDAVLFFGDRKSVGTILFTGTDKPVTVVLKLICGDKIYENRYLFLTNQGTPDSDERRIDIDAVVDFFDQVDNWALKN